jgi:hypothetical protein
MGMPSLVLLLCAETRAQQLAGVGMVKCMAFGGGGRLLALGGEDGSLLVLDWVTLRPRIELRRATVCVQGSVIAWPPVSGAEGD